VTEGNVPWVLRSFIHPPVLWSLGGWVLFHHIPQVYRFSTLTSRPEESFAMGLKSPSISRMSFGAACHEHGHRSAHHAGFESWSSQVEHRTILIHLADSSHLGAMSPLLQRAPNERAWPDFGRWYHEARWITSERVYSLSLAL